MRIRHQLETSGGDVMATNGDSTNYLVHDLNRQHGTIYGSTLLLSTQGMGAINGG